MTSFGIWVIKLLPAIAAGTWVARQVRKPSGWLGRLTAATMNRSHAALTDWALQQLPVPETAAILDVGCGGGRTVARLAAMAPRGTVIGLDYSAASVAVAGETNAREIERGRVRVEQGSVAALPFPDGAFDIVTAVETHYYWPDLQANTREILRVLKPGGTFAIVAEAYRGGRFGWLHGPGMRLLGAALLSDEEHKNLLERAGFAGVNTVHRPGTNWICAIGRRPS